MRSDVSIAAKLIIAYLLFLTPILYLGYQTVSDKERNIAFARKELEGVQYVASARGVQDSLVRGGDMAALADRIAANEQSLGGALATADAAAALELALKGTDRAAAAQAAADLIGKAADGSNLTLDPDLDSFYTQDALTVKMPAAVAGLAALAATVAGAAGHEISVADQVNIGVQTGALRPTLDGLTSDIASAARGNPDRTVDSAVTVAVAKVSDAAKTALAALEDHARAAEAQTVIRPVLDALAGAANADSAEVEHLLDARIAGFRQAELISAAVALILFAIAVAYVLVVVQRGTIRPLRALTAAMHRLAGNDLSVGIPCLERGDEVGGMARALKVFKDNMSHADALAAEHYAEQAAKERRQMAVERHTQDFGASIRGVMSSLASSADAMRSAAEAMAKAADAVNVEAQGTATGAAKSSQDLTSVAAAVEELSATVNEISRQVAASGDVARQAVHRADASHGTMQSLSEATGRIGDVVHLIAEIASQTNLLALNATIEAARAGDSGKGFAVVAGEVKALASQTAKATEEIASQIQTVRGATESAVSAMTEIGGIIRRIDEVSVAIAAAVEEQSVATREIAASVQEVSNATGQTAQAMEHVVQVGEGAYGASRDVQSGAASIGSEARRLKNEVDQFLAAIQAGSHERRQYARIQLDGEVATFRAQGRTATAKLLDISRGGATIACDWSLPPGTPVEIDLPHAEGPVAGRAVRSDGEALALVFNADPANLARLDHAMNALSPLRAAA